jgi:hypothetical protein
MGKPVAQYVIVRRGPDRRLLVWGGIGLAWLLSLGVAWLVAGHGLAPRLYETSAELEQARDLAADARAELRRLRQRQATLARSDQISRTANRQLQDELAAREDEIAALQANLAFYERLAGANRPRTGLAVHSAEFERERGGSWRYRIVLTQGLNRGAVSKGRLRFAVEGVRDGQLTTIDWATLRQQPEAEPQPFAFRYFQQLSGSVMLPDGFTPQRVRVSLRGEEVSLDQAVAWQQSSSRTFANGDT